MQLGTEFVLLLLGALALGLTSGQASMLPSATIPDGMGIEIHFVGNQARDLDLIQRAGFRFIRMDFSWSGVEREKGVYDFTPYDALVEGLTSRGLRPVFILSYSNLLYEENLFAVRTDAGREAFARFAAAGAKRYRGKGIIWEVWNEPNVHIFWRPAPSPDEYMALLLQACAAIRKADPDAFITAPATADSFLDECCERGLLELVDAISVHLYRGHVQYPETVESDLLRIRALINRFAPEGPELPVICTEWGYASFEGTLWEVMTPEVQGQFLARMMLTNLALGVPLTIWYEWRDDVKPDPGSEHMKFGTVGYDYNPKPAYLAMQRLAETLKGLAFVKRLQSAPRDYLLLFCDKRRQIVAGWTVGESHQAQVGSRELLLTAEPQYLPLDEADEALRAEGAWQVAQRSYGVLAGALPGQLHAPQLSVKVQNPFEQQLYVQLRTTQSPDLEGDFCGAAEFILAPGQLREVEWQGKLTRWDKEQVSLEIEVLLSEHRSTQQVAFRVLNPVILRLDSLPDGGRAVTVRNPASQPLAGRLLVKLGSTELSYALASCPALKKPSVTKVAPEPAQAVPVIAYGSELRIRLPDSADNSVGTCRLKLYSGQQLLADTGLIRYRTPDLGLLEWQTWLAGTSEPAPGFEQTGPANWRLAQELKPGSNSLFIAPAEPVNLLGSPRALGLWVGGVEEGLLLQLRFRDATGRVFQPRFGPAGGWWRMGWVEGVLQAKLEAADPEGWCYLEARLDDPGADSWGGKGELGLVLPPLRLEGILLTRVVGEGLGAAPRLDFDLARPQLVYGSRLDQAAREGTSLIQPI